MRPWATGLATISAVVAAVVSRALAAPDYWDPRLNQICDLRLVDVASQVQSGQGYWRLVQARFESEAEAGGGHYILYKCLDVNGNPIQGQKIFQSWPYGNTTVNESQCTSSTWVCDYTKGGADGYWGNIAIWGGNCPGDGCRWPYSAFVSQTTSPYVGLSDKVIGMGMTNPGGTGCNAHVNYRLTWRWTIVSPPADPAITLSPASFTRSIVQGANLANDTFTVRNTGGGTLNYSITDNANWLSVSPATGSSTGEADTITVGYTTGSLAVGNYSATITVTDTNASNNPQTIPVSVGVTPSGGETRYVLAYWYEVGNQQNAGNHSVYIHVFDSGGTKIGNTRVEDTGSGLYGITNNDPNDKLGFAEIPLYSVNVAGMKVNHLGLPSDVSPPMHEKRQPKYGHYSWELGFMLVPQGLDIAFDQTLRGTPNLAGDQPSAIDAPFTRSCAYYDLNPDNYDSDAYSLDGSASSFGQTFVANGNRIVMAKFQPTVGYLNDLRYGVQIRENGPSGAAVGPRAISRLMKSDEYYTQSVHWAATGASSRPVVSGNTYYAEITRADQSGLINVWRRNNNVYPNGQMYRGGTAVPGYDLVGRVVCATVPEAPANPLIGRSPDCFTRTVSAGQNLSNDPFEIWNSGGGMLNYTITDNAGWLSVSPPSGTSSGERDAITISYNVASLGVGTYDATITITDPNAANTPQTICVSVSVEPVGIPGDSDLDGDVDQEDFGRFQACLSGPGLPQTDPACKHARLDNDSDVDSDDFSIFQRCFSGPTVQAHENCAQ